MTSENTGDTATTEAAASGGLVAKAIRYWQVSLYLALYLVLIVSYVVSTSGNTRYLPVSEWMKSYQAGEKSAIGIRVQAQYDFSAPDGPLVSLAPGNRVSPGIAEQMAKAVLAGKFTEKELTLYKPGFFWNADWAKIFTLYNLLGMFGGLFLVLHKPVAKMLDSTGAKTARALAEARAAKKEAEGLKQRYEEMLRGLEHEKEEYAKTLLEEQALEREKIMQMAKHEATGIIESVKHSIDAEVQSAANRLRAEVVKQALALAQQKVASGVTAADHEKLFGEFIGDLERLGK